MSETKEEMYAPKEAGGSNGAYSALFGLMRNTTPYGSEAMGNYIAAIATLDRLGLNDHARKTVEDHLAQGLVHALAGIKPRNSLQGYIQLELVGRYARAAGLEKTAAIADKAMSLLEKSVEELLREDAGNKGKMRSSQDYLRAIFSEQYGG